MEYGFNVDIAQKLGVNEAIIIRNFQYWLQKNKANNANFYEGHYWTYNSIGAFCKIFPFWTERQIRNILKNLTDKGILIKGNFNKNPYDKTIWYSIDEEILNAFLSEHDEVDEFQKYNDEVEKVSESTETVDLTNSSYRFDKSGTSICQNGHIDMTNRAHRCDKFVRPIPDVNTYGKPCENTHTQSVSEGKNQNQTPEDSSSTPCGSEVDAFCNDYKALKNPEFEPSDEDKIAIAQVLAKNGGYGQQKRDYWCDVFKKASRGWKITEKDITRIVPCALDRVLADHSRIKANELGLLPPKKDIPEPPRQSEVEVVEDANITEAARQKTRSLVSGLKSKTMLIR